MMAFALAEGSGSTLDLEIFDVVGETWFGGGVTAKDVRAKLQANKNANTIHVSINSKGGDVIDGFAMYEMLKAHRARVEVEIVGLAASMASVIALAGDRIRMASNAWLMIHRPHGVALGESEDMRRSAGVLDRMEEQIAGVYAARTGLDRAKVRAMMAAETWMTAEEAKKHGFIDEITSPRKAAAMAKVNVQGFASAPPALAGLIAAAHDALYTNGGRVLKWQGKGYAEMKPVQRAELKKADPELFAAMRAAGTPKTYAEMHGGEKAEVARKDPALYQRMRNGESGLTFWVGGHA